MSIITRTLPAAPGSYATAAEVRSMSGLQSINDISDSDLNELILTATLVFVGHVTIRVDGAIPTVSDTARKVFQLPTGLVADLTGDALVDSNDVVVRFYKKDDDGQYLASTTGTVTVQDATFGVVKTQNALPDDYSVVIDYAHYLRPLELNKAKRAVRYLSAHLAWTRVKAPGRITRADLTGIGASDPDDAGRDTFIFKARSRWIDLYRKEVHAITGRAIV